MLPAVSSRSARAACVAAQHARRLATHVPVPAASTSAAATKPGALRPHLGIEVNPNHGLYAFFRRKEKEGVVSHETVEPADLVNDKSGRAWTAAELRRKSFKDLHTLWYVVLRERNLLATQQAEARRLGANEQALGLWAKAFRCRKTMARIKYVINERRVAYEGALQIHQMEAAAAQATVRAEADGEAAARDAEEARAVRKEEKARRRTKDAGDVAARSLFEEAVPEAVVQPQKA